MVGRAQPQVGGEVVERDQMGVGGGRGALEYGLEVGAVVAGGEVAPVGIQGRGGRPYEGTPDCAEWCPAASPFS